MAALATSPLYIAFNTREYYRWETRTSLNYAIHNRTQNKIQYQGRGAERAHLIDSNLTDLLQC